MAATLGGFVEEGKGRFFGGTCHGTISVVHLYALVQAFLSHRCGCQGGKKLFASLFQRRRRGGIRRGGIKTDDAVSQGSPLRDIP